MQTPGVLKFWWYGDYNLKYFYIRHVKLNQEIEKK